MVNIKPQEHLINIIKSTRDHHPNFTLMLGAGASASSGVKLSSDMIKEWRAQFYKAYNCDNKEEDIFWKNYSWYNTPDEYSILFEQLYDEASQRREYIETCLKDAKPSWGYIYLVNLIRNGTFNTIFTSNFDDLLNEACYLFSSEVRPIVCAHDSSIYSVRITSQRPKIIKLHGDFLFDNIKNTVRELESLEQNTKEKFKQFSAEYGCIVIGYAGNDRSIMDTYQALLNSETNFPHGVYWCVKKESIKYLSEKLDGLRRFPKLRIIEINGFDEFFAELHEAMQIQLQPEMKDPYTALAQRLNKLLDNINLPKEDAEINPIIKRHIDDLGYVISNKIVARDSDNIALLEDEIPLPYNLLASISLREKKYTIARNFIMKELANNPNVNSLQNAINIYEAEPNNDLLEKIEQIISINRQILAKTPGETFNLVLPLIHKGAYDLANKILDIGNQAALKINDPNYNHVIYALNKFQIIKHQGKEFSKEQIDYLNAMVTNSELAALIKAGAYTLLDKFQEAKDILIQNKNNINLEMTVILDWPIFKFLLPHISPDEKALLIAPKTR